MDSAGACCWGIPRLSVADKHHTGTIEDQVVLRTIHMVLLYGRARACSGCLQCARLS